MKTAEEIFKSEINKAGCMSMQVALNSMKEYSKQVAEQYLLDAINNLNEHKDVKTVLWDNDIKILSSTPIQTP